MYRASRYIFVGYKVQLLQQFYERDKKIYLRNRDRDQWRTKKNYLGYSRLRESELAGVITTTTTTITTAIKTTTTTTTITTILLLLIYYYYYYCCCCCCCYYYYYYYYYYCYYYYYYYYYCTTTTTTTTTYYNYNKRLQSITVGSLSLVLLVFLW